MHALSGETRAEHLRRMAAERVDVCVIGGGITGAGVALEAASRGASVALIERRDFASGTSGWSTKLVHGGIRYLPQGQIALVREALHERATLLKIAPHLVWPLAFVLPIYDTTRRPIGVPVSLPRGIGVGLAMEIGLTAYDVLAGKENIARHRHIPADEAVRDVPGLRTDGLKSAFVYSDAGTNDTKLVATIIRTAVEQGALVANYTEATRFVQEHDRIVGVEARDTITGEILTIAARHVVNATGVWAERVESLGTRDPQVQVLPAKGIHLVVDAAKVGVTNDAVVLPETEDGRLIFIVPWQGRAVIGTTDTPGGDIEHPRADADEIAYVLRTTNGSIRAQLTEHLRGLSPARPGAGRREIRRACPHARSDSLPKRPCHDRRRQADNLSPHGPGDPRYAGAARAQHPRLRHRSPAARRGGRLRPLEADAAC